MNTIYCLNNLFDYNVQFKLSAFSTTHPHSLGTLTLLAHFFWKAWIKAKKSFKCSIFGWITRFTEFERRFYLTQEFACWCVEQIWGSCQGKDDKNSIKALPSAIFQGKFFLRSHSPRGKEQREEIWHSRMTNTPTWQTLHSHCFTNTLQNVRVHSDYGPT